MQSPTDALAELPPPPHAPSVSATTVPRGRSKPARGQLSSSSTYCTIAGRPLLHDPDQLLVDELVHPVGPEEPATEAGALDASKWQLGAV